MKPIDSHRWSCCWSGCTQVSTMVLDDKTLPKVVEIDEYMLITQKAKHAWWQTYLTVQTFSMTPLAFGNDFRVQ